MPSVKRLVYLPVTLVAYVIALTLLSCSDSTGPCPDWQDSGMQIVPIDSIAVQDTVAMNDTLSIMLWSGLLEGRPEFSHFDTVSAPAHIEIRAWAQVDEWVGCGPMPPVNQVLLEGHRFTVPPPHQPGHLEVTVHQPDITALADTVVVRYRDGQVYFNSFESDADTSGWVLRSGCQLVADVPPGGGSKALRVSGTDHIPHAYVDIGPFDRDGLYIIGFWAKESICPGHVQFGVSVPESRWITVDTEEWVEYVSSDTLFCPAGQELVIGLTGCFSFYDPGGPLFVDLLVVSRVD